MNKKTKDIQVSVICMAYNHVKYISKTLDSIISQKTDFDFEIVVHDDKSDDGTTEIIRQYEFKFPNIVKPIYEECNQYSQGKDVFMGICMPKTKGRYIAVCEGDDFWIDNYKLQMQYDAMEKHCEVDMCACRAAEISADSDVELQEIRPKTLNSVLSTEEVILGGGRYIATASLFFRRELFGSFMDFEQIICFDYSNQIKGALRGGIYYIDRKMVAYRRATENSWTRRIEQNREQREKHIKTEIAMLRQLDIDTHRVYHKCIERRILAYTPFYEQLLQHKEEIKKEISMFQGKKYLWGLGMRGDAVQEFCQKEGIHLDGVCDKKNENIGERTIYGFLIVDTSMVFNNSEVIFVSNNRIYEALVNDRYNGILINFNKYMPLS